jgi:hypothetical protein
LFEGFLAQVFIPLNGKPADLSEGSIFMGPVINAKKSRVILFGFFSMKSNNSLSDSSLRAQTFISRGILSAILKEFSSSSL